MSRPKKVTRHCALCKHFEEDLLLLQRDGICGVKHYDVYYDDGRGCRKFEEKDVERK